MANGKDIAKTGIKGLDHVLRGGLPRNHVYLIEGDPGTGKTTTGLQFLLQGASEGDKGLYITLSESKAELEVVARSHGWSLDSLNILEVTPPDETLKPEGAYTMFHPEEVELGEVMRQVLAEVERTKPRRVVFDSLSDMRLMARDSLRYRQQVLGLKRFFHDRHQATVLLLEDKTLPEGGGHQLQSIAHGVIALHQMTQEYGTKRRRLEIVKMRGIDYRAGFHDLTIQKGGVIVYPRLVAAEHQQLSVRKTMSSGLTEIDTLLGGGLDYGTSSLIVGPAGTGKSSLAMQYATVAAQAGIQSAFYTFDEVVQTLVDRSDRMGMDATGHIARGTIRVKQIDPAELPPGEFIHMVRHAVDEGVKLVVIDSLNGYLNAMPQERHLITQMHELFSYLNQNGVVTVLIVSQAGILGEAVETPVDISYLADAVVLLRYFEYEGEVKKALSVVKKRSGQHETTIREIAIGNCGVEVGRPLRGFAGVLTGVPVYVGDKQQVKEA